MSQAPQTKDVLLELLSEADRQQRYAELEVRRHVGEARRAGAVWGEIGDALGITKQGAQKRFGASGRGLICAVCRTQVTTPKVRLEGVTEQSDDPERPWVWGPLIVHDACRVDVHTPWDEVLGDGFMLTWDLVGRDAEIPEPVFSMPKGKW